MKAKSKTVKNTKNNTTVTDGNDEMVVDDDGNSSVLFPIVLLRIMTLAASVATSLVFSLYFN